MNFHEKPLGTKLGTIGSIIFPVLYIATLIITRDPDFIVFILGPLGFIFWIVQWVAFLIGGWVLAITATVLFLTLIGYYLGRLLGWLIKKF